NKLTIICNPGSQLEKYAEINNIEVIPLRIGGDVNPITIFKLANIISKNKIDIILTNTDKELRLCGIASKISGRVKIVSRRGIDFPLKNKFHYRLTYNSLADIIVANSEATKKTLLIKAPWLNPDKIKVIYNGINVDDYDESKTKDLRTELGISLDIPLIGFVGRLSVQKGIEYLLKAFLEIKKKTNAHLLIVGIGELENDIRNFISQNNLNELVHLVGFRDDINNIMRTIDLLVLPSLWEGFGIVLIEAMAAAKPCITTNISSMPEIVKDGISGFVVTPKDHNSLAEACLKIILDKTLGSKMGLEGKRIVQSKFTIEKMIDSYVQNFESILT
ncbi:MAG TPA: glycosyltransferase family 4 protein, partial [Ignavibacteriaceae bacterium]|nr:glycosyltransferase family 4 protein [Ignavibacteriaceae bacterium]